MKVTKILEPSRSVGNMFKPTNDKFITINKSNNSIVLSTALSKELKLFSGAYVRIMVMDDNGSDIYALGVSDSKKKSFKIKSFSGSMLKFASKDVSVSLQDHFNINDPERSSFRVYVDTSLKYGVSIDIDGEIHNMFAYRLHI